MSLVDAAGAPQERVWYAEPYGKLWLMNAAWSCPLSWSNGKKNEILYAGYRYDAQANVYHVRHRADHPTLGRWAQRDIEGYVAGSHLYEYCRTSPIRRVDPHGAKSGLVTPNELRDWIAYYEEWIELYRWLLSEPAYQYTSAVSTKRVSRCNSSFPNRLHRSAMQRRQGLLVSDSLRAQETPFPSGRSRHDRYPCRRPERPGDASET